MEVKFDCYIEPNGVRDTEITIIAVRNGVTFILFESICSRWTANGEDSHRQSFIANRLHWIGTGAIARKSLFLFLFYLFIKKSFFFASFSYWINVVQKSFIGNRSTHVCNLRYQPVLQFRWFFFCSCCYCCWMNGSVCLVLCCVFDSRFGRCSVCAIRFELRKAETLKWSMWRFNRRNKDLKTTTKVEREKPPRHVAIALP